MGRLALRHNIDPNLFIAIVSCESGFNPNEAPSNKNGTTDVGLGQINSIHWNFFKNMGLDVVHDPIDNLEATAWLLEHHGTRDYRYSEHCWRDKINDFGVYDSIGTSSLPYFVAMK